MCDLEILSNLPLSPFLFDMVAFHALNVIRKSVYACMNSSWEAEQVAVTPPPPMNRPLHRLGKNFKRAKATGPRFFFLPRIECLQLSMRGAPFVSRTACEMSRKYVILSAYLDPY